MGFNSAFKGLIFLTRLLPPPLQKPYQTRRCLTRELRLNIHRPELFKSHLSLFTVEKKTALSKTGINISDEAAASTSSEALPN
jgi:hypothetical protein